MINVEFYRCGEIRMGSPFQICRIKLSGDWIPVELDDSGNWLAVESHSKDKRILALASWDIIENNPGFRITVIDSELQTVVKSERFEGCCTSLDIKDESVWWKAYPSYEGKLDIHAA